MSIEENATDEEISTALLSMLGDDEWYKESTGEALVAAVRALNESDTLASSIEFIADVAGVIRGEYGE